MLEKQMKLSSTENNRSNCPGTAFSRISTAWSINPNQTQPLLNSQQSRPSYGNAHIPPPHSRMQTAASNYVRNSTANDFHKLFPVPAPPLHLSESPFYPFNFPQTPIPPPTFCQHSNQHLLPPFSNNPHQQTGRPNFHPQMSSSRPPSYFPFQQQQQQPITISTPTYQQPPYFPPQMPNFPPPQLHLPPEFQRAGTVVCCVPQDNPSPPFLPTSTDLANCNCPNPFGPHTSFNNCSFHCAPVPPPQPPNAQNNPLWTNERRGKLYHANYAAGDEVVAPVPRGSRHFKSGNQFSFGKEKSSYNKPLLVTAGPSSTSASKTVKTRCHPLIPSSGRSQRVGERSSRGNLHTPRELCKEFAMSLERQSRRDKFTASQSMKMGGKRKSNNALSFQCQIQLSHGNKAHDRDQRAPNEDDSNVNYKLPPKPPNSNKLPSGQNIFQIKTVPETYPHNWHKTHDEVRLMHTAIVQNQKQFVSIQKPTKERIINEEENKLKKALTVILRKEFPLRDAEESDSSMVEIYAPKTLRKTSSYLILRPEIRANKIKILADKKIKSCLEVSKHLSMTTKISTRRQSVSISLFQKSRRKSARRGKSGKIIVRPVASVCSMKRLQGQVKTSMGKVKAKSSEDIYREQLLSHAEHDYTVMPVICVKNCSPCCQPSCSPCCSPSRPCTPTRITVWSQYPFTCTPSCCQTGCGPCCSTCCTTSCCPPLCCPPPCCPPPCCPPPCCPPPCCPPPCCPPPCCPPPCCPPPCCPPPCCPSPCCIATCCPQKCCPRPCCPPPIPCRPCCACPPPQPCPPPNRPCCKDPPPCRPFCPQSCCGPSPRCRSCSPCGSDNCGASTRSCRSCSPGSVCAPCCRPCRPDRPCPSPPPCNRQNCLCNPGCPPCNLGCPPRPRCPPPCCPPPCCPPPCCPPPCCPPPCCPPPCCPPKCCKPRCCPPPCCPPPCCPPPCCPPPCCPPKCCKPKCCRPRCCPSPCCPPPCCPPPCCPPKCCPAPCCPPPCCPPPCCPPPCPPRCCPPRCCPAPCCPRPCSPSPCSPRCCPPSCSTPCCPHPQICSRPCCPRPGCPDPCGQCGMGTKRCCPRPCPPTIAFMTGANSPCCSPPPRPPPCVPRRCCQQPQPTCCPTNFCKKRKRCVRKRCYPCCCGEELPNPAWTIYRYTACPAGCGLFCPGQVSCCADVNNNSCSCNVHN